jgi:hypothetical protein
MTHRHKVRTEGLAALLAGPCRGYVIKGQGGWRVCFDHNSARVVNSLPPTTRSTTPAMPTPLNSLSSTPSRAPSTVVDDTPFKTNSARVRMRQKQSSERSSSKAVQVGDSALTSSLDGPSNATRAEMDTLLDHELPGAVFYDYSAFADRFFPASEVIAQLYEHALQTGLYDAYVARWADWPSLTTESRVLEFFQNLVDNQLLEHLATITADPPIYRYVPSNEAPLKNGDCMRKTDLLLTTEAPSDLVDFAALRVKRYDWGAVRVVGELKSNPIASDEKSTLLQLANYAREVFGAQPCRRAAHAFTLCGQYLRAWLFDRSGAICSTSVDINADPMVFLRIICGYATMSAKDLGFDPSIRWDRGGETVYDPTVALVSGGGRPYIYATIQSHNEPAGRRDSTAQDDSAEQNTGTDKLEIEPTPIYTRYAIVTRGSSCWKARPYRESPAASEEPWIYAVKDQWRAAERESECDIISSMLNQDNGKESDKIIGLPRYVSFGDHRENGETVDIAGTIRRGLASAKKAPLATRSASHTASSSSKRKAGEVLHSSSSKKIKFAQRNAASTGGPPECNNRIFSRVIMMPIGKSLDQFSSFTELLSALRDAIIGHKYLYHTHQILHRDVSINNIVISPPGHTSAGVLIDLDLAININRLTKSGAAHRTGTPDFMAVGLMAGEAHRARHDIESFFFVLLWIATFFDASAKRRFDVSDTLFQACNIVWAGGGNYKGVSMMKGGYVDRGTSLFERECLAKMEDEVRAALGPLLEEWRSLLFPAQDEDALWDNMVVAVERRLAALEKQVSIE